MILVFEKSMSHLIYLLQNITFDRVDSLFYSLHVLKISILTIVISFHTYPLNVFLYINYIR